jgi:hypothetical protein
MNPANDFGLILVEANEEEGSSSRVYTSKFYDIEMKSKDGWELCLMSPNLYAKKSGPWPDIHLHPDTGWRMYFSGSVTDFSLSQYIENLEHAKEIADYVKNNWKSLMQFAARQTEGQIEAAKEVASSPSLEESER